MYVKLIPLVQYSFYCRNYKLSESCFHPQSCQNPQLSPTHKELILPRLQYKSSICFHNFIKPCIEYLSFLSEKEGCCMIVSNVCYLCMTVRVSFNLIPFICKLKDGISLPMLRQHCSDILEIKAL